jgi:hypothetical protein
MQNQEFTLPIHVLYILFIVSQVGGQLEQWLSPQFSATFQTVLPYIRY